MSAAVIKLVRPHPRRPSAPSHAAPLRVSEPGASPFNGSDPATDPAARAVVPTSKTEQSPGQPAALSPVVDRTSWSIRVVEDIACAAIVVAASLSGVAAIASGVWTDIISSQSAAFAFGAAPLLAFGLAAVGRRRLAARAYTAFQSVMRPVTAASIVATAVIACFSLLLAMPLLAGAVLAAGFVVGAAVSGLLASSVLRSPRLSMRLRRNVAIYGAGAEALTIFNAIASDADVSYAGLYEDRKAGHRIEMVGLTINGGLSDLAERIAAGRVDNVVVALPVTAVDRIKEISNRLLELPVDVATTPAWSAANPDVSGIASIHLGGQKLTVIHCRPITGWGALAKAGIDRCLAVVALVALSPLLALIAIAIKLDSKGPVLFRQRRYGVCGRPIVVRKFRTMRVMEDGAVVRQASKNDDRVTRVGRFLRRTSLDELPQLINVLEGSMSLVGPRPHAIVHDEHYGALISTYARRSIVRPGITGWSQINGLRGETRTDAEMAERVKHDLWYVANWSFGLDIKILLLTPIYGFINKNAY